MVDTGIAPIVAEQGMQADLGPVGGRILNVRMRRGMAAGDQVRGLGFEPAQIGLVVMTHLHFDHLGGAAQFPDATFVVSEPELGDPPSVMKGTYKHHRELVSDWRTYDLAPGEWEGFSRTLDLFGDGSVRIVSTPGHTRGHVSIALRLEGGRRCLLVGDAAYARRSLDNREVPLICPDVHGYLRSLDELAAWVGAHPDAVVVCGHDPWEWPKVSEELRSHALAVR
jgi:glyoxylase-like metal-dependent hydrolase (beta-lactamase superfamily II)